MAYAQRCPICNGTGKIADNTTAGNRTCHGCYGRGWVEVGSAYPIYPYPVYSWPQPTTIPPWTITWGSTHGQSNF